MNLNAFWGNDYLGVKISAGLGLRASKQSNAIIVLFSSRPRALHQLFSVFWGKEVVPHPTCKEDSNSCRARAAHTWTGSFQGQAWGRDGREGKEENQVSTLHLYSFDSKWKNAEQHTSRFTPYSKLAAPCENRTDTDPCYVGTNGLISSFIQY